jgi:catechol 2,3-dioxygenase-like lactoylglutathione lyase family enzyme
MQEVPVPFDHVSVGVADAKKAKAFYDKTLGALGWKAVMPIEVFGVLRGVGYGESDHPTFWIQNPINHQMPTAGNGVHIAFSAATRAMVDAFYIAAIESGGRDDGKPGLRSEYHPSYYGAFILDPDGNKIEAVCHAPA